MHENGKMYRNREKWEKVRKKKKKKNEKERKKEKQECTLTATIISLFLKEMWAKELVSPNSTKGVVRRTRVLEKEEELRLVAKHE